MELGMVGLGRMGRNMTERLIRGGHRVVGTARTKESVERAMRLGAEGAFSLAEVAQKLRPPRIVWLMIPAGDPVDRAIDELGGLLARGDVIVDGGNSYYKDTVRRASRVAQAGFHFVDVGTSGGIWGRTEGYSLMIGGEREAVERLSPIFQTLAPGPDTGWGRVGPSGAGHFVKMVHNGIEYGMMQAIGEGFGLMRGREEFALDLRQVAEIWRYGSVVRSWLMDLAARALAESPDLRDIAPYVFDSGEGRWTVQESLEQAYPAPVITLALQNRYRSRETDAFGDRLLAALRQQFGGHEIKTASR